MSKIGRLGARIAAGILALVFVLASTGTAFAASTEENRVFDQADLFSASEEEKLESQIGNLRDEMKMDVAVVTTDWNSSTAQDYAEEFYIDHELGNGSDYDGVLLLIDMDNRELWIAPVGKMTRYLPDRRIEEILDDMYEHAGNGDFYRAASAFLEDVEICYSNGIAADQYNYDTDTGKISRYHSIRWYEFLIALVIAGVCGGTAVLAVVREYNMKDNTSRVAANFKLSYRKDSKFRGSNLLADVLLGTYITQQVIASTQNSGKSGGSGRIGGGFSGGGRSTVHSRGGRTFGGDGRKF